MRNIPARSRKVRLGLFLAAALLAVGAGAQSTPPDPQVPPTAPPVVPVPPIPPPPGAPEISVKGFNVRAGETHRGDVVRFAPSVNIEGTLDGDMYVTAPTVRISGVVTGDVFVAGSQVDVTGEIKKTLRSAGANVVVDGIVDGSVFVTGGTLTLGSKAHVLENVTAYTGQLTHLGVIDGSLTFTGGTALLGGKIKEDASLTADAIQIEPGARVDGDVSYSTRKQMDAALQAITGGDVAFDEAPIKEKKHGNDDDGDFRPSTFGVGKWIAFFVASFLFGCALLALFRHHEPKVTEAMETDALRSVGIGFVSILVSIAVLLSCILLITIPFVVIYVLAYMVAAYLAKIPVAVWIGRKALDRVHRQGGPYRALFVGLFALYLVFMIPYIGKIAWFAAALLGLGATISVYISQRQMRKAGIAMTAAAPQPQPPPQPPPAVAAS